MSGVQCKLIRDYGLGAEAAEGLAVVASGLGQTELCAAAKRTAKRFRTNWAVGLQILKGNPGQEVEFAITDQSFVLCDWAVEIDGWSEALSARTAGGEDVAGWIRRLVLFREIDSAVLGALSGNLDPAYRIPKPGVAAASAERAHEARLAGEAP
jgi:hypothetical protein